MEFSRQEYWSGLPSILLCVVYSSFSQQHLFFLKIHTCSQSNPPQTTLFQFAYKITTKTHVAPAYWDNSYVHPSQPFKIVNTSPLSRWELRAKRAAKVGEAPVCLLFSHLTLRAEAFRTLTGIPQRLHQQVQGPENSYSTKRQVPYNHLGEKLLEPSPKVRRVASMPESKEDISFWVDEGVPCHPPLEVRTTTWQGIASNITYLLMDFLYFYE